MNRRRLFGLAVMPIALLARRAHALRLVIQGRAAVTAALAEVARLAAAAEVEAARQAAAAEAAREGQKRLETVRYCRDLVARALESAVRRVAAEKAMAAASSGEAADAACLVTSSSAAATGADWSGVAANSSAFRTASWTVTSAFTALNAAASAESHARLSITSSMVGSGAAMVDAKGAGPQRSAPDAADRFPLCLLSRCSVPGRHAGTMQEKGQ